MGFFTDVKSFFTNKVPAFFSGIANTGKNVVNTVYGDVKQIVNKVIDAPKEIFKTGGQTIQSLGGNVEGSLSSIGSSLSMPLAIVAGIVGITVLTRK